MWLWCLFLLSVTSVYSDNDDGKPITSAILSNKRKPSNVLDFGGKTYYFSTVFKGNYYQATQFCNKHGMKLVSITTQAINDRLGKFAKEVGADYGHFWTSGTNLADDNEWIWLSTGSAFTYTNWYPGEPNKGSGNVPENCMEARTWDDKGFTWNNTPCNFKFYFICESYSTECVMAV